jgi:hypothetical protein
MVTAAQQQGIEQVLSDKSPDELKAYAGSALSRLPQSAKEEAAEIGGLKPSQWVSNWIWMLIVVGFVATMVAAVATLLLGRFNAVTPTEGSIFTTTDTVVTLFTTATAFLAGLLSPSPVKKSDG